ncbi:helix-turn-helix transcriptional regulator [Endozoicomonas atrinae]|uniref:helix-turn-helix transcriptional regulator n=1 Tax=Endozoicomonas atrinae TaxID=1333660 RepID=UPI000826FECD|nr:helix-turn-helix transcriptional regulator [Endozoicomonas atrinae]
MSTLGARLKSVRKERGISQAKLAEAVGSRQSSINDIESGRNKSSTYLVKIAEFLNVDPSWLETGHGEIRGVGVEVVKQGAPLPLFDWKTIVEIARDGRFNKPPLDVLYRCPIKHSEKAYTTVLHQHLEGIAKGSVLFLDAVGHYNNGDIVMVAWPGSNMADLRRLVSNGSRTFLKSLDTSFDAELAMSECRLTCVAGGQINVAQSSDDSLPEAILVGRLFFVGIRFD